MDLIDLHPHHHRKAMVKIRSKKWTLTAVALLTIISYHNLLRIYYMSEIHRPRAHRKPLSRKEAEDSGFAYVFYATSSAYACSALVNIHKLRNLGSAVPIYALVSERVPQDYIDAFVAAGVTAHLEVTPKLPVVHGHYYEDCLLKLVVFKMHKLVPGLKRVLIFDSDQLILKTFDNLFSDIPPVDLAAPRAYWLQPEEAVFSSAFMLINLSDRLWNKVSEAFPNVDGEFGDVDPKMDMDIMNDVLGDTATILSGEYVTLNGHWENWDLPSWYHSERRHNHSHDHSNSLAEKATLLRRPRVTGTGLAEGDTAPKATAKPDMEYLGESDIYKQLFDLYDYAPIIHFTALGKPWTYTAEDAARLRKGAHPVFALQFGQWRSVAEKVCLT